MLYYHSSTHLHFIFFAVSFLKFVGNIYSEQIFLSSQNRAITFIATEVDAAPYFMW